MNNQLKNWTGEKKIDKMKNIILLFAMNDYNINYLFLPINYLSISNEWYKARNNALLLVRETTLRMNEGVIGNFIKGGLYW